MNSRVIIETSCCTVQNVEWSDALVDTNDLLQCVYSTSYKANDWCGADKNLNRTIL